MPPLFVAFTGFLVFFCLGAGMFGITVTLVGKPVRRGYLALYCGIYCAVQWALNLWTDASLMGLWWDVGVFTLHAAVLGLLLWRGYRVPPAQAAAAAALGNFVTYTVGSVLEEAAVAATPVLDNLYLYAFAAMMAPYLVLLAVCAVMVLILQKVDFYRYFVHLFAGRGRTAATLAVCLALMHARPLIDRLLPGTPLSAGYAVICFFGIVLALLALQFMAMYAAGRDKIRAQEELIAQQQAHMQLLEELQQEVRAFRHDFANLFAGLTLQAQAGDLAAIQDFMRATSGYFDEKLGAEIRQLDVLANLRSTPVRSLLAAKLAAMRRRGIRVELEVLHPVADTRMAMEDLLRCLGILLDNAAEAAAQTDGRVRIVLLQEARELYVAVANNFDTAPDLAALVRRGYTTKGGGRGTGLASYRKLVARCPGCAVRTYLKDGFFVQELRIPVD